MLFFYEFLYPMYPVSCGQCGGKNCLALLSPSTIESTWQNKRPRVRVSCSIFFHELLFGTSWNTFIWFSDSFTTIVPSFGERCFFTFFAGHFPAKRRLKRICLLQWACALCPNRGVRGSSEVQWPDARLADDAIGKQAGDVGFSVFQPHKKSDSVVWIRISVFSLFFRMKYGKIRRVHRSALTKLSKGYYSYTQGK